MVLHDQSDEGLLPGPLLLALRLAELRLDLHGHLAEDLLLGVRDRREAHRVQEVLLLHRQPVAPPGAPHLQGPGSEGEAALREVPVWHERIPVLGLDVALELLE